MRWQGNRQSDNVEDRRGDGPASGGGLRPGGRSVGLGGIVIALLASWIFGVNPLTVLGLMEGASPGAAPTAATGPAPKPPASDEMASFVSTVLADTEDVWNEVFKRSGGSYEAPHLVLFRGSYPTACGTGQAAMGPFYCPGDRKVYIDLAFYDTLRRQLGSPGDFAQAYVIAHEVGHHVQNLMGITDKVDGMRGRVSETKMNALSVRVELQADCLAGVWANHAQSARQILESGDVEEALNAASHIGDDALQRQSGGPVVAERFTHGSSAQRVSWFRRGMEGGRVQDCNTFDAKQL
jgi:uncharacterized protein